ncbi:MAG: 23S rRNA (adenine(2503)-C(2))-methyltransferase RlmN [Deltaproteobacteria bacterium]|jgi:23S rRNA (adenine2503-C2)-methyltransferase|nr:23S rRNA (adenine(2503)-C(2))-methyltransferase RlmN [Deltaproteobacteria bacterium]
MKDGSPLKLLDLSPDELIKFANSLGEKDYRGKQLAAWLFRRGAQDFASMTDISAKLKALIAKHGQIEPLANLIAHDKSPDGAIKLLFSLYDGHKIESVLISEADHYTLCVSSQVGCPLACSFCRTGTLGFTRNLSSGEILSQILIARKIAHSQGYKLTNLVFMGMGEPLLNTEEVLKSIQIIVDPQYLAIPKRQVTLSTVGLVKGINTLGASALKISLAVSLNSANEEKRALLMPGACQEKLESLKDALLAYPLPPGRRITIAYVVLKGVNHSPKDAKELIRFLSGLKVKINLIPFNPWPKAPYERPCEEEMESFKKILTDKNYTVMVRKSYGSDVSAACGQLVGMSNNN